MNVTTSASFLEISVQISPHNMEKTKMKGLDFLRIYDVIISTVRREPNSETVTIDRELEHGHSFFPTKNGGGLLPRVVLESA